MNLTQRAGIVLAILAVLFLAIGLRAFHLGDDCFDCDELYAVRLQGLSPKVIASVMSRDGFHTNHPPFMTVPFLAWSTVFGTSEVAVRSLPCLAGVLAVVAVFTFGWLVGHPWAGVFAAAILTINPLHITYSTEARQYALVTALLATAQVLFVAMLQYNRRGLVLAYYFVATWAALTHYFAVPVLLGHMVAAGWFAFHHGPSREPASRLLLAVVLAGLPYLAWLPVIQFQARQQWDHLTPVTAEGVIDSLIDVAGVGGWGKSVGVILLPVACGLLVIGIWAGRQKPIPVTKSRSQQLIPNWLGWLCIASGILAGISFVVAFPRSIEPVARQTLTAYGYDALQIQHELALLKQTILLGIGTWLLGGCLLLKWRSIEAKIARIDCQKNGSNTPTAEPHIGTLLTIFLVVPLAVIALAGLTDLPIHQTRNLLVLLPLMCVTWGFAFERLSRTAKGTGVLLVLLAGLGVATTQYHAVARVWGGNGTRLGIDTPDWRGLQQWLIHNSPPDQTVVVMNRPVTDPAIYYLKAFQLVRITPGAEFPVLPPRLVYVHITGNALSERVQTQLRAHRALVVVASGQGWELYATQGLE
jgi:4-amino-4-deoxy-L-arabinose transferase-like glycosyltransferase